MAWDDFDLHFRAWYYDLVKGVIFQLPQFTSLLWIVAHCGFYHSSKEVSPMSLYNI